MQVKLGKITKIHTGKLNANAATKNGVYPFFTCSKEVSRINRYSYNCECVLVAGNGDLNVKYYKGKFDAYQRTYIIENQSTNILYMPYLYYYISLQIDKLRHQSIGGVIKYIKLNNLTDMSISLPSIDKQKEVVKILRRTKRTLDSRKTEIHKLDKLIKARFVEMFGDPINNQKGWNIAKIEDVVEDNKYAIKAGPFGSTLKKEFYVPKGYKIYGQEQVIKNDPYFGDYYISRDKYESLKNCKVKTGDVLISLVGTYGKLLIMPTNFEPGIINPRLMKISFDKKLVNPTYFKFFFQSDAEKKILTSNTHGGTMGILNVSIIKKVKLLLPPLSLQKEFVSFVQQVDKSKVAIQKSLDETQTLFDSLMQKYFS